MARARKWENDLFLKFGPLSLRLWDVGIPHTEGNPIFFVMHESSVEAYSLRPRRHYTRRPNPRPRIIRTPVWMKERVRYEP